MATQNQPGHEAGLGNGTEVRARLLVLLARQCSVTVPIQTRFPPPTSYYLGTLERSLCVSKAQFPHLSNGGENSNHLIGFL